MSIRNLGVALVLLAVLILPACAKDEGTQNGNAGQSTGEAMTEGGGTTDTGRSGFEEEAGKRLENLRASLEELKSEAGVKGEDFAEAHKEQLDRLEKSIREAQAKLDELKKSGEEAWPHLREGFEKALKDLDKGFKDAADEFKKQP